MPDTSKPRFIIIGGGLSGALTAVHLGRAGHQVDVYERRPDPRGGRVVAGRSINLALSVRGLHALGEVGLADEMLNIAVSMPGRMIHAPDGGLSFQPYDKDPTRAINSVSRGGLNRVLIETAEASGNVRVHFDHKCVDVDLDLPAVQLINNETGQTTTVEADVIIGADGAFSTVRGRMQHLDRFNYRQDYLEHGYKELTIPPADDGGFRMKKNALHIWPRRSFMMIALPNRDGSFTCTCFWPFDGPNGFARLQTPEQIVDYFKREFPDAVPLMPTLAEDYLRNPASSLCTVRCGPWHYRDKTVLIGDAAHAIVPFYGQGINCGFEDCSTLDACMKEYAPDWRRAFSEYDGLRKKNADAIADLALANFIEMRDRAATRSFRMKKSAERTLHRLLPGWFTPLYTMVTFTRIPYSEAVARARRQDSIVRAAAIVLIVLLIVLLWTLVRSVM